MVLVFMLSSLIIVLIHNNLESWRKVGSNSYKESCSITCYWTEFGCCSFTEYCDENGIQHQEPITHHFLEEPKLDEEGTNCPEYYEIVREYSESTPNDKNEDYGPYYGRCKYNPLCYEWGFDGSEDDRYYGVLNMWKIDKEGSNCPRRNMMDFVGVYNQMRRHEYIHYDLKMNIASLFLWNIIFEIIYIIYYCYTKDKSRKNNFKMVDVDVDSDVMEP